MKNKILNFGLSLVTLLMVTSCASDGSYGKLVQSNDVQQAFVYAKMPATYNYYYNGPENNLVAIVGLDKDIVLTSKYWHPIDLTEERMKNIYSTIQSEWFTSGNRPKDGNLSAGANLFDPAGKQVGVLFTKYRRVVVRFSAPKTLSLSNPIETRSFIKWDN
ncbi:MAG: hypothetical protein OCC45_05415 [Desulfotalea sp.]